MIKFHYKNHRGVIEERMVEPISLDFMNDPEFNYPPGWFLRCKDYSRGRNGDERSFYLHNIFLPEEFAQSGIFSLKLT